MTRIEQMLEALRLASDQRTVAVVAPPIIVLVDIVPSIARTDGRSTRRRWVSFVTA